MMPFTKWIFVLIFGKALSTKNSETPVQCKVPKEILNLKPNEYEKNFTKTLEVKCKQNYFSLNKDFIALKCENGTIENSDTCIERNFL